VTDEPRAKRWRYLVKPSLQLRYALFVFIAMGGLVAFIAWNAYFTIGQHFFGEVADPRAMTLFDDLNAVLLKRLLAYMAVLFGVSIFLSHKLAGPLYRFERFMEGVAQGRLNERVALRRSDALMDFQETLNGMTDSLREKVAKDRQSRDQILKNVLLLRAEVGSSPTAQRTLQEVEDLARRLTGEFQI